MAKIYLIRHAESAANTQGKFQGQTYDTPLSPLGKKQTRALQKRLSPVKFTAIFSSPLRRTMETARFLGKPIPTKEIIETNHGLWEGKTKEEVAKSWPDLYSLWLTYPSWVVFPQGEVFNQTYARALNWLERISGRDGTFIVITHSNIITALLTNLLKKNLDEMWNFEIQPTAVSLIETNSGKLEVKYYNDSNHLDGLASDLTKQAI